MSTLLVQGVATVLLADFVSGVVHWAEDAYARPTTPLLGRVARTTCATTGDRASSWRAPGCRVRGPSARRRPRRRHRRAAGWLSWHVVLFAVLVVNANQIHKWAHMNRSELPFLVGVLQRLYLLQTARHHGRHHAGTRTTHYCVITNFLNPLLEEIGLWSRLEAAIERWSGVRRRDEAEELALLGLPARKTAPTPARIGAMQAG